MYKILIVEDNSIELYALKDIILEMYNNAIVDTAGTYHEACQLMQNNQYSFYFFDIQLDNHPDSKSGIDLAYLVRENPQTSISPIIFITTITCNVQEAVNNLHCYSYINKPYNKDDIYKCINSLCEITFCKPNMLLCKDISGVYLQIPNNEIIHITADRHILTINCTSKTYKIRQNTLDNILTELGPNFIKCHKSHIVNKSYIRNIDMVTMRVSLDRFLIPIGRAYKNNLTNWSL